MYIAFKLEYAVVFEKVLLLESVLKQTVLSVISSSEFVNIPIEYLRFELSSCYQNISRCSK